MENEVLIIPAKYDEERESLAASWKKLGGQVQRLDKFWVKPETGAAKVSIYGNDTFALVLAQVLGMELLSPKDEKIADFPYSFVKREIRIVQLKHKDQLSYPIFIKSIIPKQFKAGVYSSLDTLESEIVGLAGEVEIITSEVIAIEKEVRAFVLAGKVLDLAYYEGKGELASAKDFLTKFLEEFSVDLPITFVIDLGWNEEVGWFIIELNATWGAGLNNCKAEKVIECIRCASI
ncbi:MAG: ATP-grasp domain-containing protein [Bacteroidota bacterium]